MYLMPMYLSFEESEWSCRNCK